MTQAPPKNRGQYMANPKKGGPGAATKHELEMAQSVQNLDIVYVWGGGGLDGNSIPDRTFSIPDRSDGATNDAFCIACPKAWSTR